MNATRFRHGAGWLLAAAALLPITISACAGGKSGKGASAKEGDDTLPGEGGPSEPGASGGGGGGGGGKTAAAPQLDPATQDFLAAIKEVDKTKTKPNWEDNADRFRDLTKKHPDHGPSWYNLGVSLERTGKIEDAESAYQKAEQLDPNLYQASENRAGIAVKRGDSDAAAQILRSAVDRGASGARVSVAENMLEKGNLEDAVQLSKEALAKEPKNVGAYCVLARAATQQKDYTMARLLVGQAQKLDKDAGCLHYVLGLILFDEKKFAQALGEYEMAGERDPSLVETHFRIAQISMGVKDFRKAIASYDAVLKNDPNNAAAYLNEGVAFKGMGRFQDAEKAYQQAIAVTKDAPCPEAYFNLGVLYMRNLNRPEDAKTALKRYLQIGSAAGDDPAFGLLEEIEQQRAMGEEMKRQEEEAKRQEALEKKAAEEEAKRKAEEEAAQKKEAEHDKAIDKKAGKSGAKLPEEPDDPGSGTPPIKK